MPRKPKVSFYISPSQTPLTPADSIWQEPLPVGRPSFGKPLKAIVTHGEYFEAIRSFIEQDELDMLSGVMAQHLNQGTFTCDFANIFIHLEKHGEFYHPARIEVGERDHPIGFVLNGAVSSPGKDLIDEEFHNLKRLNAEFSEAYLPRVYALGQVTSAGPRKFSMFLGEWLRDYHEFHVCAQTSGNTSPVCVWDDRNGRYFLSRDRMLRIYRQAAAILTYYYNIETFEHISRWHHAAGDFILRQNGDHIDLKLITVRGYTPLFQNPTGQATADCSAEQILQALLIFFLKLSFWMRLDRLDGVGEMVWLEPGVVQSTVDGVLDGLAQKKPNPNLPEAVATCFKYYLSVCTPEDLLELSDSILQTFASAAPEVRRIKQNLDEHVRHLHTAISDIEPE